MLRAKRSVDVTPLFFFLETFSGQILGLVPPCALEISLGPYALEACTVGQILTLCFQEAWWYGGAEGGWWGAKVRNIRKILARMIQMTTTPSSSELGARSPATAHARMMIKPLTPRDNPTGGRESDPYPLGGWRGMEMCQTFAKSGRARPRGATLRICLLKVSKKIFR